MRPAVLVAGLLLFAGPSAAAAADTGKVVEQASAQVCDKRVVLLAELPSHGEARAFSIKAEVVKALVQRCGFKALVFEAPIYDFIGLEPLWGKGTATARQLDRAIGRFWWARELGAWRQWLFQQAEAGTLALGGMDDQVSITSDHARSVLPPLVEGLLAPDQGSECRAAVERNLAWSYDPAHPFQEDEKLRLRRCTRNAALAAQAQPGLAPVAEGQVMSRNLAGYVDRQVELERAVDRDEAMFRNLKWYLARMPPEAKLIVWTATVHASKQQGARHAPPLGTLLQEQLGDSLGVIGFTALGGRSSMAGRPVEVLEPAPPDSLERRALTEGADVAYLDSSALMALGLVESRLLGKVSRADWSKQFDGVVVIAEEMPASFEAPP